MQGLRAVQPANLQLNQIGAFQKDQATGWLLTGSVDERATLVNLQQHVVKLLPALTRTTSAASEPAACRLT